MRAELANLNHCAVPFYSEYIFKFKFPFFAILRTFSPITQEVYIEMKSKI